MNSPLCYYQEYTYYKFVRYVGKVLVLSLVYTLRVFAMRHPLVEMEPERLHRNGIFLSTGIWARNPQCQFCVDTMLVHVQTLITE